MVELQRVTFMVCGVFTVLFRVIQRSKITKGQGSSQDYPTDPDSWNTNGTYIRKTLWNNIRSS
jgi:hypothetical protein